VGKKSAKGKKALAKVETRLIDKKKKHQVSQAKKAGQKAAQKNVKRKLARRRRSAGNAFPKKVRPLMTKKQVKGELAKQKEYQLAKKGIALSQTQPEDLSIDEHAATSLCCTSQAHNSSTRLHHDDRGERFEEVGRQVEQVVEKSASRSRQD